MEEGPENGKESPHSAHANGMKGMKFKYTLKCECCKNNG
jgi:hypothetical protein